jgi:hypothetical protein
MVQRWPHIAGTTSLILLGEYDGTTLEHELNTLDLQVSEPSFILNLVVNVVALNSPLSDARSIGLRIQAVHLNIFIDWFGY